MVVDKHPCYWIYIKTNIYLFIISIYIYIYIYYTILFYIERTMLSQLTIIWDMTVDEQLSLKKNFEQESSVWMLYKWEVCCQGLIRIFWHRRLFSNVLIRYQNLAEGIASKKVKLTTSQQKSCTPRLDANQYWRTLSIRSTVFHFI